MNAGTGRKKRHKMRTMPTAKAMSLPPRFAAGAAVAAVNDIAAPAHEPPPAWPAPVGGRVGGEACARIERGR
jgi:hypothetical protein